ncbi:chloride channel protein [Favolaschia claudopus]|uniref:Chloride channel protein n=1 Tax=Favolaschia claudopus TaxID=2862362 RepID=A0AAW0E061_9AGAR
MQNPSFSLSTFSSPTQASSSVASSSSAPLSVVYSYAGGNGTWTPPPSWNRPASVPPPAKKVPPARQRNAEEETIKKRTAARIAARLAQDRALVLNPDTETPFVDTVDVVNRLLPYHIFQQPKEDLDHKTPDNDLRTEIQETRFAIQCFKRKRRLEERFRRLRTRSGKRPAPDDQAVAIAQAVLEADRAEIQLLNSELRAARAELERRRAANPRPQPPVNAQQYYRFAYAQPQHTYNPSFASSIPPTTPSSNPNPTPYPPNPPILVTLPVASLPSLQALGIIPVASTSLVPGAPPPPAVLRETSADGSALTNADEWTHSIPKPARVASTYDDGAMDAFAPTTTAWRRQRLTRISSNSTLHAGQPQPPDSTPAEGTTLRLPGSNSRSYGTLPTRHSSRDKLPPISLPSQSSPSTPPVLRSPSISGFRDLAYSRLSSQRPISSYDTPREIVLDDDKELDARINGVRVWYSSFTSIDWLHDAIKDSVRFSRLRRRKSLRARVRLVLDKSMGWFIVTAVGFLTAVVAFLVVRAEQWLFDIKEGYCRDSWWKARRFCCLESVGDMIDECPAWQTWSESLLRKGAFGGEFLEYVSYSVIAVCLATLSCVLTLLLTNSTTFSTRKESGVLAPGFADGPEPSTQPKRPVMYYAAGSGIPEIKTILSGFVIHGYLGGRTLFTKSVGLALSVASGLSLGKEGPFVHLASCIGNIVSRFTTKYENNEAKRREILSAAAAAGVAVAFGAPIGGTLFSLEEVSYYFPPKIVPGHVEEVSIFLSLRQPMKTFHSFFCAMIAAITLKILDPFGTGKLVLFQVTYDKAPKDWHAFELLPFLLLGVFGGLYGAYFSKLNIRWSREVRNKTWLKDHPIAEVMLITLVTAAFCFLNPYTRMGGTELVYNLFSECRTGSGNTHSGLCVVDPGSFAHVWPVVEAILVAMIVKGALTVITFGIKLPAGIFIPTLGVGACAGRILGIGMQWMLHKNPEARLFRACGGDLDCIIPGLYAMVGAAATLSGLTRTTISLSVIMFELTDSMTYTVPLISVSLILVAKTLADALEPKGIYDLVIELSQLPYLDSKHEYLWGSLQVNDVTARDVEVIRLSDRNTVRSLIDQLQALYAIGNHDGGFPILRKDSDSDNYRMVGYIGANELEHALSLVADDPEDEVQFHPEFSHHGGFASASISSLLESGQPDTDPFDFSIYMDQAPLTVQSNSPLEMVQQYFTKLGARYVVVTDTDGLYEGVIDKKTWLAFLSELEEK